ncbi:MAG TPA: hypothetical protein VNJ28_04525, partial [Candidatus Limnocylindrales bacterium]|nr:hypothetical protein [Candidatus Limnocylindrales bacterium]
LEAYRRLVDETLAGLSGDEERRMRLEAALGRHRVVLETLVGLVPEQASDAIERALEKSDRALDVVRARGRDGEPGRPDRPGAAPPSPRASEPPGRALEPSAEASETPAEVPPSRSPAASPGGGRPSDAGTPPSPKPSNPGQGPRSDRAPGP